jgi:paraquat-inducible protein B
MTIIEIIVLILTIVGLAGVIGYQLTKGQPYLKDMVQDVKDIEVKTEQVANELYNKDLRPIVAKKAPKKEKVIEQVESMKKVIDAHDTLFEEIARVTSQDITQEVVEKVVEIAKITPEATTVNLEAAVEKVKETKSEFPIDKPKKKRKYYPRKPKPTT